ncbi:MAG: reverse transcriptase domain-containing protein [Planctomycetota bacterium]|nr:reverse transcriptase domain-containing protein [Planctomycetota bacterium]
MNTSKAWKIADQRCASVPGYGFRPGRAPHQALDALYVAITEKRVNWILDADVEGFFDNIDRDWLVKFIEHRVGDKRIVRLIQKWLNAGIIEGTDPFTRSLKASQSSL